MCLPNYDSNIDYPHIPTIAAPADPYMSTRPMKSATVHRIKYVNKYLPTYNFRPHISYLEKPNQAGHGASAKFAIHIQSASLYPYPIISSTGVSESLPSCKAQTLNLEDISFLEVWNRNPELREVFSWMEFQFAEVNWKLPFIGH